jgi:hypothetical protein
VIPPTLNIPAAAWRETLAAVAPYAERRLEGGCLWYGDPDSLELTVSLVGVPTQINRARNFEIPAGALAALNNAVPASHVVLAQLHTHPGAITKQSPWDDRMLVSRKIISIVLPHYGRSPCELATCGLHVFIAGRWRLLQDEDRDRRIRFTEERQTDVAVIDLR